jgi:hypothetical protein
VCVDVMSLNSMPQYRMQTIKFSLFSLVYTTRGNDIDLAAFHRVLGLKTLRNIEFHFSLMILRELAISSTEFIVKWERLKMAAITPTLRLYACSTQAVLLLLQNTQ